MAFRFACADFTFPLLEHDKVLTLIGMMGFEGVDIGLFQDRSHIQPSMVLGQPTRNGAALKDKADGAGIKIADVFLQCALDFTPKAVNHPDAAVRAEVRDCFERFLEYAAASGSPHVTCLPGVHFAQEEYEASFERTCAELAWRAARAAEAGLVFGVEAHLGSIADTPAKAERLVKETPGLTLTLDYTHFTKTGTPDSEVEPLIPCASHFHARGAAKGCIQTVAQDNTIDYRRVAQAMKQAGYRGYIGIEYTWTAWENCNRTDNLSETLMLRDLLRACE